MKKSKGKFRVVALVLCALSIFTVVLAEPGSTDDPLVSKAYIDTVLIPEIKQFVENKISEVNTGGSDAFKVVEVAAGQEMICSAGTELILRMGKANIIATEKGGLADTTAGFDLQNGTSMPSNHLLIVPVADGRGIKATEKVLVMVKGGYQIN